MTPDTRSTRVGLVQACTDPRLFDLPLWPRQRDVLEAVERGPRMHVLALGRRSGKTTMSAVVGLWTCLFRPEVAARVRPGERFYAVAVATNLRQARLFVQAAASIVAGSELLRSQVVSQSEDEIVFKTGGTLTAFPCSSRGGRGWPIACLLMDEAAHFLSESEGPAVAEKVFAALSPSTAQFSNLARVIVSSTPFGSDGFFAELYTRVSNGELDEAMAHRATTQEMNPTVDAAFLAREEQRDPEAFRSEYLAEFVGSGGAFLDPEVIAAAVAERQELPPEAGTGWVAGLDPAFSSDPFGLAIVGRDRANPERLVLGRAQAWQPRRRLRGALSKAAGLVTFDEKRTHEDAVLEEVAKVCKRYRARVVTDQFAAPQIVSRLRALGLSVRALPMTASSKTEVFLELRARLNTGELELYPEEQLLGELRRLRTRYTAGSSSVVNPRVGGSHGDMAQALALAVHEQRGAGSALPFDPDVHVVAPPVLPHTFERLEALHFGAASAWIDCVVDAAGSLIVVDEFSAGASPSEIAPLILERRAGAYRDCYAGPVEIVGRRGARNDVGAPLATIRSEFACLGIALAQANDGRPAGFVRLRELLRLDEGRRFPSWHPRAGEPGAPGLFIASNCRELAEQIAAARLEEDDEPLPRAAISQRWELAHGSAVAALRYAAMTRPAPSPEPPVAQTHEQWVAERQRELLAAYEARSDDDDRPRRRATVAV